MALDKSALELTEALGSAEGSGKGRTLDVVGTHSEQEPTAATYKKGYGFHPLCALVGRRGGDR